MDVDLDVRSVVIWRNELRLIVIVIVLIRFLIRMKGLWTSA